MLLKGDNKIYYFQPNPNYLVMENNHLERYDLQSPQNTKVVLPDLAQASENKLIDYQIRTNYSSDITDLITKDKLGFLSATAKLLTKQIENRSKIKEDILGSLDCKINQCSSYITTLESIWPEFLNPMVEAKKANLSNMSTRLEMEKNTETARCWSDQIRLQSELLKTLGDYQAVIRRSKLITGK